MTQTTERLIAELEALPVEAQAEIARRLLQTLKGQIDPEVEAAWDEELTRREAEIRNGTASGIPLDDVLAELREKYP